MSHGQHASNSCVFCCDRTSVVLPWFCVCAAYVSVGSWEHCPPMMHTCVNLFCGFSTIVGDLLLTQLFFVTLVFPKGCYAFLLYVLTYYGKKKYSGATVAQFFCYAGRVRCNDRINEISHFSNIRWWGRRKMKSSDPRGRSSLPLHVHRSWSLNCNDTACHLTSYSAFKVQDQDLVSSFKGNIFLLGK
jgi:hypothetical protein